MPPGSRSTDAGVKGNAEILGGMDMIVAAGGGERDLAVDSAILTDVPKADEPGRVSQRTADERSAPDAVSGAAVEPARRQYLASCMASPAPRAPSWARKAAGVDAVRIALARIAAGQSEIALVGGAHNGERKDMLLLYEFGALQSRRTTFAPVWERGAQGGFALGSLGAFLVLEAREHAEARGAKPLARLTIGASPTAAARKPGDSDRDAARHVGQDRRRG